MRPITACAIALSCFVNVVPVSPQQGPPTPIESAPPAIAGGELRIAGASGDLPPFPLKRTEVHAEIAGLVAQVRVSQVFQNPYDRAIEAVYIFPLPRRAAVDEMEIQVGDRTIRGVIKKREEARAAYDEARRSGRTAALLDQERPNLFTQSVANILPGEEISVSIRYFDRLPYESGFYEFTFPMVVGPRFMPGASQQRAAGDAVSDTPGTQGASRTNPPMLGPGQRPGHDISLEVQLQAGTQLQEIGSATHAVDVERPTSDRARIVLRQEDAIPNKNFVLRYRMEGAAPQLVLLPHRTDKQGHFLILIQPEADPSAAHITPKEMIFVVDCSGSMSGFPIQKVQEAMRYALENLNPLDNFQIIRFADTVEAFAPEPVPATPTYLAQALDYVGGLSGNGGTILLDGVKAALSTPEDPQRLRIISFMTDGFIGNEEEILAYLRENLGGARLFSFGVGSSPNRYLLDKMAEFGRGGVEYLLLNGDSAKAVHDFYDRIHSPYLTDLELDWGSLAVSEIYPPRIPDLFLGQPVVLFGTFEQAGSGEITLRGRLGGQPYEQHVNIQLPEWWEPGEAIRSLWARAKIEELSDQQIADPQPATGEAITDVALTHQLVSAYTSFVAVEERPRTTPEEPVQVPVSVPMPEGMTMDEAPGTDSGEAAAVIGGVLGGVAAGVPATSTPQTLYERVQVAGRADGVNTESTQISTTITSEYLSGLPILGTDYQDVLTLAPGVTQVGNTGSPNIHGARDTDVVTQVDGVSQELSGGYVENLSVESIEEIEVITAGASASFGRAQGGFVAITPTASRKYRAPAVFSRLGALRKSYHAGEPIELYVAIRNLAGKTVKVPASLSVPLGTAPFRILDETWQDLASPIPVSCARKQRALAPGEWIVFKILLNGKGGYRLERPGLYYLVFLGSKLGLPDSTQLALRINP
jgi:Ca-activated chloride channel family protein